MIRFATASFLIVILWSHSSRADDVYRTDVAIYGATPAGIAAAIEAGRARHRVLLIETHRRIGGMVTNGLSHPDFRTFEALNGFYLDFTQRVKLHYAEKYGGTSKHLRDSLQGTHAEPQVNLNELQMMLRGQRYVAVRTRSRLVRISTRRSRKGTRIANITVRGHDGTLTRVEAKVFIDATYEGDLMAAAGVAYTIGREGKRKYNESLAPEKPDKQLQGYNFRLTFTRNPRNRVDPKQPDGYRREDYLPLLKLFETGKLKRVFCYPSGGIYKAQIPVLPGEKHDINDVSRGAVRLSLPNLSDKWPEASHAERKKLFAEHLRHHIGMLYFLQNDKAVPAKIREEARQLGLCKDEFVENDHLPEQLYVREARRMIGRYVFTENDTNHAKGDARGVLHTDAIAVGDYGPNCHGTAHIGPRLGGKHTGEFYKRVPPYQIPHGVILPKTCDNLLVPVACSASHVGFCALRLEPIWSSLGQAAGIAAVLAIEQQKLVADVAPKEIQRRLHKRGAATIYISDVAPGSADFAVVQWWGTLGGFHGLAPHPKTPGERGKHRIGQYYHAFPNHAAELNKPLDSATRTRWNKLLSRAGVELSQDAALKTRGDFVRHYFARQTGSRR